MALLVYGYWPPPASSAGLDRIETPPPSELTATTLDGIPWSLGDLRGRVVLIHFWAGWCPSCVTELPALNRLNEGMRGRPFAMIGVDVGEPELRVRTLIRQLGIRFPVLLDPDSAAFTRWQVRVLPTTYLLDVGGCLRLLGTGPQDWDDTEVRQAINAMIPSG